MLPSSQLRDVTLKDYFRIFKRRMWFILIPFIITTLDSGIKTFKKVPIYQATAKIIIERSMPEVISIRQVYAPSSDREYTQGQINIITSRSLSKKVVEYLISSGDKTFAGMTEPETAFLGGVNVSMLSGTPLLTISYTSTDPFKAAKFANAIVEVYIQEDVQKRIEASTYATGWLEVQLAELKEKLRRSEGALNDYLEKYKIVAIPDIDKRTESGMQSLKKQKQDLENSLPLLFKRYKAKHPKMISALSKLDTINKSIEEETRKLFELNKKMIEYSSLKREVDSSKSLFESLLKRIKETEVAKELQTTNIRIVDLAIVPKGPFSPNRKRDIQMGAMFGLFLGLGLAFLIEYLDSTVKTAEHIEMYVKLPFLGYVPSALKESRTQKDIDLICHKAPRSRVAEALRSIRTSLIFSSPEDRPLKTLLVTSASSQEGKTTLSLNLGIIFTQTNERVLILEGDMRKPRIAECFGINDKEGLSSYLTGTSSLDNAIKETPIPNLFLLPSGHSPPNPTELLISTKTRTLLEELKLRYDRVIIDSPPVLTVTDTVILANMVDGVIDIIRAGYLNIELILRARQRLYEAKARIIGVVLNNVNVKREDAYYYYHYYYGEKQET